MKDMLERLKVKVKK